MYKNKDIGGIGVGVTWMTTYRQELLVDIECDCDAPCPATEKKASE